MTIPLLTTWRAGLVALLAGGLVACGGDDDGGRDAGSDSGARADASFADASVDASVDGGRTDASMVGLDGGAVADDGVLDCFDFSDDPDVPLALDGAFGSDSPTWRRPYDVDPMCPATALLPDGAALVPFVAYAFCNHTATPHTYDVEWIAADGPAGEPPLDDPYLVVYEGAGIPPDARACLGVNDDIPDALEVKDSELLGVVVPAGGALTVAGTAYTFDPTDGTGTGGYLMVVTNAD